MGKTADPGQKGELETEDQKVIDEALEALYDHDGKGSLGPSAPNINRWLKDIRTYFPTSIVQLMQKDALEKLEISQMLLEPETLSSLEIDVHLAATLIELNQIMPEKTKETARMVIQKLVKKLHDQLRIPLKTAIVGAINKLKRNYRPKFKEVDWHQTIQANLKHYQPEYKTIIPERLIGYGKKQKKLKEVILLIDQSGSMASSVIYACVLGSILASLPSIKTYLVVFDTQVVDLTDLLLDPVDLLFASQLGGGTDIGNALKYAQTLVKKPSDTILILLSDLYEGGSPQTLIDVTQQLVTSGIQFINLLALSDQGSPSYDKDMAQEFTNLGIPSFACTPDQFPGMMAAAIQKQDMQVWISKK